MLSPELSGFKWPQGRALCNVFEMTMTMTMAVTLTMTIIVTMTMMMLLRIITDDYEYNQ